MFSFPIMFASLGLKSELVFACVSEYSDLTGFILCALFLKSHCKLQNQAYSKLITTLKWIIFISITCLNGASLSIWQAKKTKPLNPTMDKYM